MPLKGSQRPRDAGVAIELPPPSHNLLAPTPISNPSTPTLRRLNPSITLNHPHFRNASHRNLHVRKKRVRASARAPNRHHQRRTQNQKTNPTPCHAERGLPFALSEGQPQSKHLSQLPKPRHVNNPHEARSNKKGHQPQPMAQSNFQKLPGCPTSRRLLRDVGIGTNASQITAALTHPPNAPKRKENQASAAPFSALSAAVLCVLCGLRFHHTQPAAPINPN